MSNASSPLIAHIVSQTRQNVEFLMAQNEIPRSVGQDILTKLPTLGDVALRDLSEQTSRMTIPSPPPPSSRPSVDYRPPSGPPSVAPSGPPARRVAPQSQPQPRIQRAKALWAYNENGSVSGLPNSLATVSADCNDPKGT
jgi:LAS seventeen-binding protein 1/2